MFKKSVLFFVLQMAIFAQVSSVVHAAPVDDSGNPSFLNGGGNLTSFSGNTGAINNNQYNQMMNPVRVAASAQGAQADFGNCNALIQRCATPKCAGCNDLSLATPIVAGCVASTAECQKYGDPLVNAIAAQIVSANTAKANNASSAQSAEQLKAIQDQMQQMQQQQADSAAQMQSALAAQQQANQAAMDQQAELLKQQQTAAASTQTQSANASNGVSSETIARQQVVGQVMSSLDGVDASMAALKKTVQEVLDYGKCDYNATNCEGPRRVATFRKKAQAFFEPYDSVLDSLENSLYTAMAAGVDVTDIYMMLTNSCNQWGKYLCKYDSDQPFVYSSVQKDYTDSNCVPTKDAGHQYRVQNLNCTFIELYRNDQRAEVQQNFILANSGDATNIRMACMVDNNQGGVLTSGIFGSRRSRTKSNGMDIDALEIIINQDAPSYTGNGDAALTSESYCAVKPGDEITLEQKVRSQKYDKNNLLGGTINTSTGALIWGNAGVENCLDSSDAKVQCFANPMYAMCSTHVYNIGLNDNKSLDADAKNRMNKVIGLKATLVAQQLKKQNDYLASVVKQIKIQMQKAVMTTVSNGSSGGGSSGGSSSSSDVPGTLNCAGKNSTETIMCLRQNFSAASSYASSHSTPDMALKNRLDSDAKTLGYAMTSFNGVSTDRTPAYKNLEKCNKDTTTRIAAVQECLNILNAGFIFVDNQLTSLGKGMGATR